MNPRPVKRAFGILTVFLFVACSSGFGEPTKVYAPYNYIPTQFEWTRPMKDVVFGNGIFVAIGFNGTVLTSKDGVHWTNHSSDLNFISTNYANINFSTETYSAGGDSVSFVYVKRLSSDADL